MDLKDLIQILDATAFPLLRVAVAALAARFGWEFGGVIWNYIRREAGR